MACSFPHKNGRLAPTECSSFGLFGLLVGELDMSIHQLLVLSQLVTWVTHRSIGEGGGGGGTQFVHGRSRMTIYPRILTMPRRSTSGFHQPGRHCWHQARSAVRCCASRMRAEMHPSKNRSYDGLRHLVPTFLLMNDSANELLCFLVWPLQRPQWVLACNCLVGALPYSHYVMR